MEKHGNNKEIERATQKKLFCDIFRCDECIEKYIQLTKERLNGGKESLEECFKDLINFEDINFLEHLQKKVEVTQGNADRCEDN